MEAAKHKPVIVYVEDNSGDALLLREAFIERGHDVELLIIEHGERALHYFDVKARARDVPPPHCILLDEHLPMVTGIQLIVFLRQHRTFDRTPVFLFAAPGQFAEMTSAVGITPDSFLRKPTSWEHFRDLADTLMRGAWLAQHLESFPSPPEQLASPPPHLKHPSGR